FFSLSQYYSSISLDPIFCLPFDKNRRRSTNALASWLITRCGQMSFTKQHAIYCLDIHCRLQIPESIINLLNKLPNRLHFK
ncbi:hypothetical protein BCV72DRAFT_203332, partial [Rhizopus microsporus var. microsporus]